MKKCARLLLAGLCVTFVTSHATDLQETTKAKAEAPAPISGVLVTNCDKSIVVAFVTYPDGTLLKLDEEAGVPVATVLGELKRAKSLGVLSLHVNCDLAV